MGATLLRPAAIAAATAAIDNYVNTTYSDCSDFTLTVFKAKHPVTIVDSTKLEDFHVSLDPVKLRVDLNVTLGVDVSVKNLNKVGFQYSDSAAHLNYRGQLIGEVSIYAGEISSGETKGFNLTHTIMADRLLSNSQLLSDVTSGTLPQTLS
ncbi:hypothetical protein JHK87_034814 [Glycine soja]|nr:hypothetical protein JHK87_034814 [Glycine soja]